MSCLPRQVLEKGARKTPKARSQPADEDEGPIRQYMEDCAAKPCQKPHGGQSSGGGWSLLRVVVK